VNRARDRKRQHGFSLIEVLAALGMFLLITGAAFSLLTSSQQRYKTDSELLTSFQEARLGIDQMVRDINDSGFPPPSFVSIDTTKFAGTPFAWSVSAGYSTSPLSATPCQLGTAGGGTCTTSTDSAPGDFDIIIETNPNPNSQDATCTPNCPVQWIRYQLAGPNGTTLMRAAVYKVSGGDPDAATSAQLAPFVENVVNNSPTLQIGQFQLFASYPTVFQGGNPVPIFSYTCDTPTTLQYPPPPCFAAGVDDSPANIRDVAITLIVAAPLPDATTGQPRLVQLSARGRRVNPNQ
jgi:prepilin-type N-terminal cleavage/methylation domain-containing protein